MTNPRQLMKKIFVTSHDQDWLFLINKSLEQAGFEVHFVEQGKILEKESPDLLIIDTQSTDDLLKWNLNFDSDTSSPIPVVVTSGDYTIKKKVLNSGANEFLKKPFHTTNLISLIKKL
jgi:DNA-binding response OmpR family regulator